MNGIGWVGVREIIPRLDAVQIRGSDWEGEGNG